MRAVMKKEGFDSFAGGCTMPRVSNKDIPTITFPTSDYEMVVRMSNRSVVRIFREHIWSARQRLRLQVTVPEDHDAYAVNRTAEGVSVLMLREGSAVCRCMFVPPQDY